MSYKLLKGFSFFGYPRIMTATYMQFTDNHKFFLSRIRS